MSSIPFISHSYPLTHLPHSDDHYNSWRQHESKQLMRCTSDTPVDASVTTFLFLLFQDKEIQFKCSLLCSSLYFSTCEKKQLYQSLFSWTCWNGSHKFLFQIKCFHFYWKEYQLLVLQTWDEFWINKIEIYC